MRPLDCLSNNIEKRICNINKKEGTVLKIVHYKKSPLHRLYVYIYLRKMMPEQLKDWRRTHNISQAGLAELLGMDVMSVSRWERGIINIPSFLHLALRCLELEGGEQLEGAQRKRKESDKCGKGDL